MRPRELKLADVEHIAFHLAQKLMEYDEPIPSFGTRFPEVLESCLATPFQKYEKKYLYRGLIRKAANLFCLMIKNHPFQNGNKRIATTTLLVLLHKNKKWLHTSHDALYAFSVRVASSLPDRREAVLVDIESFIRSNLVSLT